MNARAGATGREPRWLPPAAGLVIALAVAAAYANSLSAPFVFDDGPSILDNPTLRHLWPIASALSPPAGGVTVSGRPVLNLSLALNHAVSGTSVWSYHVGNVAIHILAALALFGIVRRTPPRSTALAFGAALLWAVHPLQTEAVTYVVQRAESLMGLFYLLTLYSFVRGVQNADGTARLRSPGGELRRGFGPRSTNGGFWFFGSFVACLLGMGTKEVMVSAPVLVFVYDRTFLAGTFREAWRRRRGVHGALAATWIPLALLVAGTGGNRGGTSGFDVGVGWWAYGLTQFQAVARYLALALWPHRLVFEYGPFWVTRPAEIVPYALIVVPLAAGTAWALAARPALGFLGLWFFAILAPTSLVPGTLQMIVEHRMYLPLAAVTVAAAAAAQAWLGPRIALYLLPALAVVLGVGTARRNRVYRTELSLWGDTVAKRPDNPFALYGLGVVLAREGRAAEAMQDYARALQFRPGYADARQNLGNLLFQAGRVSEALAQFQAAIQLRPGSAPLRNNYGNALAAEGRSAEAVGQLEEALRLQPDYPEAAYNLGNALAGNGRLEEAIARYREALRLDPRRVEAHTNLGVALARTGRVGEAIGEFESALRLRPDSPEEMNNLGNALAQAGRRAEARVQYGNALRLRPDYAQARQNLARLAALPDGGTGP